MAQVCGTTVYDTGGPGGSYANNENWTQTYCPDNLGDAVTLTFSSFATQLNSDVLYVYNGPTTASPLLYTLNGTQTPPVIRSTDPGGCLTVQFISNGTTVAAGWEATISCAPLNTNLCGTTIYDPGGNANYIDNTDWTRTYCPSVAGQMVVVDFSQFNTSLNNDILYVHDGPTTASPLMYMLSGTALPSQIRATNPDGCLTFRFVSNATIQALGWVANLTCSPRTICGMTVLDPWSNAAYVNNADWTYTYCPDIPGQALSITFSAFNTQLNNDFLEVYNGPSTSSPMIYRLSGTVLPPVLTSTDPSGCITLRFTSNASTVAAGWVGTISCAPRSDCGLSFLDIGGNQNYPLNSDDTYTWCPDNPGDVVQLDISTFNVHATDQFIVFNGPDINSPSLGTYNGTINPGSFISTHPTGCLTVRFISDGASVNVGWVASVNCPPRSSSCGATVYDAGGPSGFYPNNNNLVRTYCPDNASDVLTLTLPIFSTQIGTDILFIYDGSGVDAPLLAALNGAWAPHTFTSSMPGGCLTIRFTSNATTNDVGWVGNITCAPPPAVIPTCGLNVYDPGGPGGHYTNNMDWSRTYCPETAGDKVTVTFTEFNMAAGDFLYVYNGSNTSSDPVGPFTGTVLPPPVTSTSPDGCLTLRLTSNASGVQAGWTAGLTCAPPPVGMDPVCTDNASFESGGTAGWTCRYGSYDFSLNLPNTGCLNPNGPNAPLVGGTNAWNDGDRHTVMTDRLLLDRYTGVPTVPPDGPGNYSFRLGNDGTGCGVVGGIPCPAQATSMRFPLAVTAANAGFTYRYSAVMRNPVPTSPPEDRPRFEVIVYDPSGVPSPCGYNLLVPGSGQPQLKTAPDNWQYTNWEEVGLDLTGYIGQTVEIEFRVANSYPLISTPCTLPLGCSVTLSGGVATLTYTYTAVAPCERIQCTQVTNSVSISCSSTMPPPGPPWSCSVIGVGTNTPYRSAGAHAAYAYIDTYCKPLTQITEEVCMNASMQLCAPAGYANYAWLPGQPGLTGPLDQRCVTVDNPTAGTVYTVQMELVSGCPTSASITLVDPIAPTSSRVNPTCPGGTDGSATVAPTGGATPFNTTWNTVPVQSGSTATGLGAGNYTATIVDGDGCAAVVRVAVDDAIGGVTPVCSNGPTVLGNTALGNTADVNWGCLRNAPLTGSWYNVTVTASGELGFTIVPEGPANEYDWALWGPFPAGSSTATLCLPPNPPIRCEVSSTAATVASTGGTNTGAGLVATPLFAPASPAREQDGTGCGSQCGWLPGVEVQAGDGFLLYVDNRAQNGTVFDLIWTLSGGASVDCSVLPIDLVRLRGEPGRDLVDLRWTTLSEQASHRFVVERSGNGRDFTAIGALTAAGWSRGAMDYHHPDRQPLSGVNYYRLRMEDLDGTYGHSNTVAVFFHRTGSLVLRPNPANDRIAVELPEGVAGPLRVEVHDASGRLALTLTRGLGEDAKSLDVPLTSIEAGSYLMRLFDGAGMPVGTARFVKQ